MTLKERGTKKMRHKKMYTFCQDVHFLLERTEKFWLRWVNFFILHKNNEQKYKHKKFTKILDLGGKLGQKQENF